VGGCHKPRQSPCELIRIRACRFGSRIGISVRLAACKRLGSDRRRSARKGCFASSQIQLRVAQTTSGITPTDSRLPSSTTLATVFGSTLYCSDSR